MTAPIRPIKFPALHLALCLTLAGALIVPLQISVLPKLGLGSDPGVIFKTVLFTSVAIWYGFMMGIIPMMVLAQRGPLGAVWGFFTGTMTHVLVAILVTGLMVGLAKMPAPVVAISLMSAYIPLLAVQITVLRRHLAAEARNTPLPITGSTETLS